MSEYTDCVERVAAASGKSTKTTPIRTVPVDFRRSESRGNPSEIPFCFPFGSLSLHREAGTVEERSSATVVEVPVVVPRAMVVVVAVEPLFVATAQTRLLPTSTHEYETLLNLRFAPTVAHEVPEIVGFETCAETYASGVPLAVSAQIRSIEPSFKRRGRGRNKIRKLTDGWRGVPSNPGEGMPRQTTEHSDHNVSGLFNSFSDPGL